MNDLKAPQSEERCRHTEEGELPLGYTHDNNHMRKEPLIAPVFKPGSIYDIQKKWQKRGADVRLAVSHRLGEAPRLEIDFIGIPKASRGKGYGSKMIKELTKAADSRKMDVALTPESSEKSERSKKFFEQHGFRQTTVEEEPVAWMTRKIGKRFDPKGPRDSKVHREVAKPKPTSLFMENAKKFKGGDKEAFSDYGGAGKIDHCASGSKASYGYFTGDKEHEKRPPRPTSIPAGHFVSWNEKKKDYELIPKKKAYGGVVFNYKSEILLKMPAGHCDGYVWTFPKVGIKKGEAPEETAKRAVEEQTGVKADIISAVPGSFEDDATDSRFYVMQLVSENHARDKETAQIAWVKPEEAQGYISQTLNEKGKEIDASTLEAAVKHAREAFKEKVKRSFSRFTMAPHDGSTPVEPEGKGEASVEKDGALESDAKGATEELDDVKCSEATHVRNALIYWGQKEHRAKYSAKEQREISARILREALIWGIDPESLGDG